MRVYITDTLVTLVFFKTCEIFTLRNREMRKTLDRSANPDYNDKHMNVRPVQDSLSCPYCESKNFVRRGLRKKKFESIQLYICKNCNRTFTSQITKGKRFPLETVLEAISLYNLGYNLEETCRIINTQLSASDNASATPVSISAASLSNWLSESQELCRYFKMRPFITKNYSPDEVLITATLAHRQLYRYRYHRGKCELLIESEYRHRNFAPLKEFLEIVPTECPHQYFAEGLRASETPLTFNKSSMIVRGKSNFATRLCEFVLQSVKERKGRHEALQKFMLANDSVTVATEIPVYLTRDDIEHMKTQLGFEIYAKAEGSVVGEVSSEIVKELPKLITGHIDILQIRNGMIHILDYKPKAAKEQPIDQLTLYAMALSRLTGLRLYEFKCAWFDEKDYFEFYPLHVLHKPKKARRRRKISTTEGTYLVNKESKKIESLRPNL